MTALYEDFFPYIQPDIAGAPEPIMAMAVKNACIEFCEKSLVLIKDHDPVTISTGVIDYDLEPPTGYIVVKIMNAWLENNKLTPMTPSVVREAAVYNRSFSSYVEALTTPQYYLQKDERTVTVWGVPDKDLVGGLTMRVALKPSRASTSVDSVILEDHAESIAQGAMFRLMVTPGRPYSNPQMAAAYKSLFQSAINTARLTSEYGRLRTSQSVTMRKI